MSKDHFYFSRNDRIVALILLAVIILSKTAVVLWPAKGTETDAAVDSVLIASRNDSPVERNRSRNYSRRDSTPYQSGYSRSSARRYAADTPVVRKDTVARTRQYQHKTAPQSAVDLNAADSMMLVSLPGIGPYYARRIIRYRNQLGGFVRTSQLSEIEGVPDSVMKWFIITDTVPVIRLNLNNATLTELRNHPYINFYQARAVVEFRRERGKIKGPEQLSFLEEFTAQDLERLEPYLDFN